jgi:predicted ATPase
VTVTDVVDRADEQVTLLLTDVEGSTLLMERDPDLARSLLAEHDALVATNADAHRGQFVRNRSEGDSAFLVFTRHDDAVRCALALQRDLRARPADATPIRVRMGLHTGKPHRRGEQLYGPVVNRCGAVRNLGHGGQVLLSSSVALALAPELIPEIELRDLGEHRLKGLNDHEHVFQACIDGMPADFPPLRSPDVQRHNLPADPARYLGDRAVVDAVAAALDEARLVTLVGTGGLGKTVIALEVARTRLDAFADGVWLAELDGLVDHDSIVDAIASALGVREQPGQPLTATLAAHVASRALLLVLDGLDGAAPGMASLVAELVRGASARVLVTSRSPVGLAGERAWPVAALATPRLNDTPDAARRSPAVELFLDRARVAQPGLDTDDDLVAAVAAICRRLEGVPLAIELAAARLHTVPASEVLAELETRLAAPGASDEDRSVRAALESSTTDLDRDERLLFRRSSVFAGGFTLEAAEGICAGDDLAELDVLDALVGLVDRALLTVDDSTGGVRYRSLESVRAFATALLDDSPDPEDVRTRHRRWFADLVQSYAPDFRGGDQRAALDACESDHDNLLVALSARPGEIVDDELWTAAALVIFWQVRGHWALGRRVLEQLLELPTALHHPRAQAELCAGGLAAQLGDYAAAARHLEASYSAFAALEHDLEGQLAEPGSDKTDLVARLAVARAGAVGALLQHCDLARLRGQLDDALTLGAAALDRARAVGDDEHELAALGMLGVIEWSRGDLDAAGAHMTSSLERYRLLGDDVTTSMLLNNLGALEWLRGDFAAARALYDDSLELRDRLGDRGGVAQSLLNLADVDLAQGRDGRVQCLQSLAMSRELGHAAGVAEALRLYGELAAAASDLDAAVDAYVEAGAIMTDLGDTYGAATVDLRHARAERQLGALESAATRAERALHGHGDAGDVAGASSCRAELAVIAHLRGETDAARGWLGAAAAGVPEIAMAELDVLDAASAVLAAFNPAVAATAATAAARWREAHADVARGGSDTTGDGTPAPVTLREAVDLVVAAVT